MIILTAHEAATSWLMHLLDEPDDDLAWQDMHPDYQSRALQQAREEGATDPRAEVLDALRDLYAPCRGIDMNYVDVDKVTGTNTTTVTLAAAPPGDLDAGVDVTVVRLHMQRHQGEWTVWGSA